MDGIENEIELAIPIGKANHEIFEETKLEIFFNGDGANPNIMEVENNDKHDKIHDKTINIPNSGDGVTKQGILIGGLDSCKPSTSTSRVVKKHIRKRRNARRNLRPRNAKAKALQAIQAMLRTKKTSTSDLARSVKRGVNLGIKRGVKRGNKKYNFCDVCAFRSRTAMTSSDMSFASSDSSHCSDCGEKH